MTPFLPKFTSTRSVAFLNVSVSLNDNSSPLHLQKKANSPTTFSTFFFFIWSLSRHRKTSKLSREIRTKVEFDHHRVKTNTKAFHGGLCIFHHQGDILWSMLVATVFKKYPYGNIVVFNVVCDKFWPCFEYVRFWKAIFHNHNWLKTKLGHQQMSSDWQFTSVIAILSLQFRREV